MHNSLIFVPPEALYPLCVVLECSIIRFYVVLCIIVSCIGIGALKALKMHFSDKTKFLTVDKFVDNLWINRLFVDTKS